MKTDSKKAALRASIGKTFEKNAFAKSYREKNNARHVTREIEGHMKNIPEVIRRKK